MVPPFDIFRQEEDGKILWIGAAATLEDAERVVGHEMLSKQSAYLIVSMKTGTKRLIEPER